MKNRNWVITYVLEHTGTLGDLVDNIIIEDGLNQDKKGTMLSLDTILLGLDVNLEVINLVDSSFCFSFAGDPFSELVIDGMTATFSTLIYPTIMAIGILSTQPEPGTSINSHYRLERFPNLKLVRVVDLVYSAPDPKDDPLFAETIWYQFDDRGSIMFEDAEGNLIPLSTVVG